MASRAAALVAGIIDLTEDRPRRAGRPPLPTIKVVEALRFFVREGVPWRELRATDGGASGSTLRRRLDGWSATAVLRRVHVALVRMVRAGPEAAPWDVVVDSCSGRAKRGGELTGPNPTDRGKAGTKHHVVVATGGLPLGVVPSAANVHDTRLLPHLLRLAQVVCAAIGRLYADAGYASAENRGLCLRDGIQPCIREVGQPQAERDTHLDRGVGRVELAQGGTQALERVERVDDEGEPELDPLPQAARAGAHEVDLEEDGAGVGEQRLSGRRQRGPVARAVEEADAELGLEVRDPLAHGGLDPHEPGRGGAEAAGLGDRREGAQLVERECVQHDR
jgi:transposase